MCACVYVYMYLCVYVCICVCVCLYKINQKLETGGCFPLQYSTFRR
jgi:hypothetical protein